MVIFSCRRLDCIHSATSLVIIIIIIIMSQFLRRKIKKILRCAGWHKKFSVSVQMSEPCT